MIAHGGQAMPTPPRSANEAILAARPTDPAALAVLLRWLLCERRAGGNPLDDAVLEHVAARLEPMGAA